MKKDLFNNNIKPQFVSYVMVSLILEIIIFVGLGVFFILLGLGKIENELTDTTLAMTFVLGIVSLLIGILLPIMSLIVIRKYPKYESLTSRWYGSDYFFVGVEERNFRGGGRAAYIFDAVASAGDNYKPVDKSLYPKRYWVYIWLVVAGIILLVANIVITAVLMNNMAESEYYENLIMIICIGVEIFLIIVMFFFAFNVKKIRMDLQAKIYGKDR